MDERLRERYLEKLARFRLIDDTFMRAVFREQPGLVAEVLGTLTGIEGLTVIELIVQYDLRRIEGTRSVVLDVRAVDGDGALYDMEVQRGGDPDPRRLRYYSSVMDVESLGPGQEFSELPEQWVVFVMEGDPFGEGLPTYRYEYRRAGTGEELGDGTHLLYANGDWSGDDAIGRLMRDFKRADPAEMETRSLRERVQYLKDDPEGVQEMCEIEQELRDEGYAAGLAEGRAEGRAEGLDSGVLKSVRGLMSSMQVDAERAMDLLGLAADDRRRLAALL